MNKENSTRGAAGLRRSAIAERIRLREEWSALKGAEAPKNVKQNVLAKKLMNSRTIVEISSRKPGPKVVPNSKANSKEVNTASNVLRGVVALVEIGDECRALPLRAALAALGATVAASWSPLVTHLVWTDDGGSRPIRAKARALGCKLVSPLWVEACAASATKLNERTFPTASRQSDLPSPRTLRQLLKKAEAENVPLMDLLSDSKEDNDGKTKPLRISTDTEQDTSTDKTTDTSKDTIDVESRINTAPRRALPNTSTPASTERPARSRRKLFTHKEAELLAKTSDDDSDNTTAKPAKPKRVRIQPPKLTQRIKRDLARAERVARRILATCQAGAARAGPAGQPPPRIVLTGMSRAERQTVTKAVQELNGRIQRQVTKRTTHVLLGNCRGDDENARSNTNHRSDITGVTSICDLTKNIGSNCDNNCYLNTCETVDKKARTLNALLGAARGCRVLYARWAIDGAVAKKWLHHHGYEVHHLRKICQKARVERTALGRMHTDYAYDVFNGMRIRITTDAEQRDAAIQLLKLCGAVVEDGGLTQNGGLLQDGWLTQNGGRWQDGGCTQNGGKNGLGRTQNGGRSSCDSVIGCGVGEIASKWVFDSVAAGRMRTTRRYVNSCNALESEHR